MKVKRAIKQVFIRCQNRGAFFRTISLACLELRWGEAYSVSLVFLLAGFDNSAIILNGVLYYVPKAHCYLVDNRVLDRRSGMVTLHNPTNTDNLDSCTTCGPPIPTVDAAKGCNGAAKNQRFCLPQDFQ